MAALILPSRRVVQPQGPVEIDWANPLARGFSHAVFKDFSTDIGPVSVDGGLISASMYAHRSGFLWGNPESLNAPFVEVSKTRNGPRFSLCFDVIHTGNSTRQALVSQGGSGGSGRGWYTSINNQRLAFTLGGVANYADGPTVLEVNRVYRVVITLSGNSGTLNTYIDGGLSSSISVGNMLLPASKPTTLLASHNGTDYNNLALQGTAVGNVLLWDREISAAEARAISENPWQLFKPIERRIWVGVAGGGPPAQTLTAGLLTNAQAFYSATISQTTPAQSLTAVLFTNSQTFYAPTVTTGVVTLTPSLVSNGQTFYAATVSQTIPGQSLTAPLLTNGQTFYGPTIGRGAVAVSAPLTTNTQTFYAATVVAGGTLGAPLLTNEQTFYGPTVVRGAVVLSAPVLTNTQAFYRPTIEQAAPQILTAPLVVNEQEFYPARIGDGLESGGLTTAGVIPRIWPGLTVRYEGKRQKIDELDEPERELLAAVADKAISEAADERTKRAMQDSLKASLRAAEFEASTALMNELLTRAAAYKQDQIDEEEMAIAMILL